MMLPNGVSMGRLNYRDESVVTGLVEETRTIRLGHKNFWPHFLLQLNEALRARVPVAYGVKLTDEGPRIGFFETPNLGSAARVRADMDFGLARKPADFVFYNPARPARDQRNSVKTLGDLAERGLSTDNATSLFGYAGIGGHDQIRVLVCEGEALLAWVGAFRPGDEPFTDRERQILRKLAPALRKRLTLEQQLLNAPLARAALEVSIEALARPAMVVNARGEAQFSNTLARRLLEADPHGVKTAVKASIDGASAVFELTPLKVDGAAKHYLAIETPRPRDSRPLVIAAGARWSLTPRESQVIHLLSDGLSNHAIAVQLSCAERTVEVHVARLLAKSDSESRSQLIARFWNDGTLEKELRPLHVHA